MKQEQQILCVCVWQRERERGLIVTSWFHHWLPVLPLGKGNRNAWLPAPHLKSRGISAVSSLLLLLEAVWLRCPELLSPSGQRALCLSPRCEVTEIWIGPSGPDHSAPALSYAFCFPHLQGLCLLNFLSFVLSLNLWISLSFSSLCFSISVTPSLPACLPAYIYLIYLSSIYSKELACTAVELSVLKSAGQKQAGDPGRSLCFNLEFKACMEQNSLYLRKSQSFFSYKLHLIRWVPHLSWRVMYFD